MSLRHESAETRIAILNMFFAVSARKVSLSPPLEERTSILNGGWRGVRAAGKALEKAQGEKGRRTLEKAAEVMEKAGEGLRGGP